ncbi:hypothetical protein [Rhodococcus sp. NPDC058639]|uniref:hypothetical protein n=1 Tax=Rhodococcus sp. NPDC058639 TaxID=3346570 RepID=UPI00364E99E5
MAGTLGIDKGEDVGHPVDGTTAASIDEAAYGVKGLHMWALLSKPVRRWVLLSLAVPLVAGGLSLVAGVLQRRKGHPTKTSKSLLAVSNFLRRRRSRGSSERGRSHKGK